jgi:hypothetical protein
VVGVCEEFGISADYLLLGREPAESVGLTMEDEARANDAVRAAIRADLRAQDLDPAYTEEQIPSNPIKALSESILERIKWETVAYPVGFSDDEVTLLRVRPRPKHRGNPEDTTDVNADATEQATDP